MLGREEQWLRGQHRSRFEDLVAHRDDFGPSKRHGFGLVLEDAGASWDDIVDVTGLLTDMKQDFPVFNRLYAEHLTTNRPTRTTVEVGALPTPIAVELKMIAALRG